MNKGLEALKRIKNQEILIDIEITDSFYKQFEDLHKDFVLIEKELKALEIIKDKASIDLLEELNDDEPYWLDITCGTKLTQEEFDLLKEVLL